MDLTSWTPRMLSVLRIVTGLLFLEHGTGKLLGFPPSDHAAPTLFSLIGVQGALELVGGLLILIGLFTRPVAFVLAGNMAVAYFMAHAPKSFFPTLNGGQLAILFCFVLNINKALSYHLFVILRHEMATGFYLQGKTGNDNHCCVGIHWSAGGIRQRSEL